MDAEALKALFEPFGSVTVKRMFGGSGIYAEGLCFAIEADGEVFVKTDALSRADFSAADSAPFTYVAKGKSRPTSYWSLPAIAHDEARHAADHVARILKPYPFGHIYANRQTGEGRDQGGSEEDDTENKRCRGHAIGLVKKPG